jgi:hypothetical protein
MATRIGVVILHTRQDSSGVVIEKLCVWSLPPVRERPTAHQEWREVKTAMFQVLESRDRVVAGVTVQHVVVAAKSILEPWSATVIDPLRN